MKRRWDEPELIFEQYRHGAGFKAAVGERGICRQAAVNERFYVGDQWHGARCGDQKPLVRYNIIKRIGDYKMAMVAGSSLAVNFSAEGVPSTAETKERLRVGRQALREGGTPALSEEDGLNLAMDVLGDYFKTTAERVKLDQLKNTALRRAFTSGTGVLYTWWDSLIPTGLFADEGRTAPITGDIRCEVLDVENVFFGDPHVDDVQAQPYIIIARREDVDALRREAKRYSRPAEEIDRIRPDRDERPSIDSGEELPDARKATVLTKFYKQWNEDGTGWSIRAVRVVQGATVRGDWDLRVRLYPLAVFCWETRPHCAYGLSEVTHLVPNQIAINRAITASANAVMMMGMPIMVVNEDVVAAPVTNDPGQIIPVNGGEDMGECIRYVAPQNFTPQFDNLVNSMIANTLTQAGANDAALGDMRPDNTSAIIAVREAATMPMQLMQNRFYSFVEDVARIWAEFWVTMYGKRPLRVRDEGGEWYIPFDGEACRRQIINVRVDVGPANLWSEIQSRQTLDNLFAAQLLTPLQYLERLPKGSVPDQTGLVREARQAAGMPPADGEETAPPDPQQLVELLPPESREAFRRLTPEQQQAVFARVPGLQKG